MEARRTVLVTGFEPFDGERVNPSAEVARQLHGVEIRGQRVVGGLLPCVFGAALRELARLIKVHRPLLVICVGQAGGRDAITPERVAINIDDARIPDNAGRQPVDRPVVRRGPAAYWSGLPVKAIVAELKARGIPASISQTAGTYLCNHVFYGLMYLLRRQRGVRGGFIHVPYLPEQAPPGVPSLEQGVMTEGIALAVETALRVKRDRREMGGALS